MILDLTTGKTIDTAEYSRRNSTIQKKQTDTGIRIKWISDPSELLTTTVQSPDIIIHNDLDRGEYFTAEDRPKGTIGILVHSSDEPCAFAAWHQKGHKGDWSVYGDQPGNSQQTYFLGGAETVFVGLF
ncbi:uncharacterized protein RJT20DRAFT_65241 [Scheffersomyces xylosifermentans]|uniref:uncharacterized protein n=1 Tax=Scheffersomyces xylosifermentans TaxID=1304137 RepID=UPI00315DEC05